MKKWTSVLLVLAALLALMPDMVKGEGIQSLRESIPVRWTQRYFAHGREVVVDIPLALPKVDALPVLRARVAPPPSKQALSAYPKKVEQSEDGILEYWTEHHLFGTSTAVAIRRPLLRQPQGIQNAATWMTQEEIRPEDWDRARAYLPTSPLTLGEAEDSLLAAFNGLFSTPYPLALQSVFVQDVFIEQIPKDPDWRFDQYLLSFTQTFSGVPLLAQAIHCLVDGGANKKEDERLHLGEVSGHIRAKDSYLLQFGLFDVVGTVADDLRIAPFPDIQKTVEGLIAAGKVRRVYDLSLGYVLHPDYQGKISDFLLFPQWVLTCDYYEDEQVKGILMGPEQVLLADSKKYGTYNVRRRVLINPQTGEVLDPFTPVKDSNRAAAPVILP